MTRSGSGIPGEGHAAQQPVEIRRLDVKIFRQVVQVEIDYNTGLVGSFSVFVDFVSEASFMVRHLALRGLWVCIAVFSALPCLGQEDGFKAIFNGKDLSGWAGRADLWTVEDGAITGRTTPEKKIDRNTFVIWQDGKVGDFELRLKFKMQGGNSGIQYRSRVIDQDAFVVGGYQADIDAALTYAGINYEEQGRGILALRGQRVTLKGNGSKEVEAFGDAVELGKVIKAGEWNDYRVVAKGNRLQHYINDTLTAEVIDEDEARRANEGVLAFQIHVGPPMVVQFKDIMLKEL